MLTVVEAWILGPYIDAVDQFEGPWIRRTRHRSPSSSHQVFIECHDLLISYTLFQYPIRRLIVRFREVSKPQNLYMKLSDRWAAETPNKFKHDAIIETTNLAALRLHGKWGPGYHYSNIIMAARLTYPKQNLQKSHKWSLTFSYIYQFIKRCEMIVW